MRACVTVSVCECVCVCVCEVFLLYREIRKYDFLVEALNIKFDVWYLGLFCFVVFMLLCQHHIACRKNLLSAITN